MCICFKHQVRTYREPVHVVLDRLPVEAVKEGPCLISALLLHRPPEVVAKRLDVVDRSGPGQDAAGEPDDLVRKDLSAARLWRM